MKDNTVQYELENDTIMRNVVVMWCNMLRIYDDSVLP